MNIAFVYEGSFATQNGSNHLLESIICEMLNRGHFVHLFQPIYGDNQINEYPNSFSCKNFIYCPIKMKAVKKTHFVRRFINSALFAKKCSKEFRHHDIDLFFIQSSPTASFVIRKVKRLDKPIVYNIFDVFPGSNYEIGVIKYKIIDWIFKKEQRAVYKKVDTIIVVSEDMRDILLKQKVDKTKINIVYTWFDSNSIKLIDNNNNTFLKEFKIDTSKLIIQYAGNVGQVFGLDEFIKIVKLTKSNNNIEFHIIGSGVKLEMLKSETADCNIRFFEWQPQNRMSEIYSYPDIEIIPLHHGVIGNDVPSKMALAMACGKPVLNIVEKSKYYDDFNCNGIGWAFEQDDLWSVVDLLNELSFKKESLQQFKNSTIAYTNRVYSKSNNVKRVVDIVDKYCL